MANATDIQGLLDEQSHLMDEYREAQDQMHEAIGVYQNTKATLMKFQGKYGRVIDLMNQD